MAKRLKEGQTETEMEEEMGRMGIRGQELSGFGWRLSSTADDIETEPGVKVKEEMERIVS